MKGAVILACLALNVAIISASPLTLERKDEKPMSIVDVPAGIFDETQKPVESSHQEVVKDVEKIEDKPQKETEVDTPEEQGNIFGFRVPTIMIIRRPVFQDPFAGFQSPFFSNFNRRPSLFNRPIFEVDSSDEEKVKDREPLSGQDTVIDEQTQNETVIANNVIQRMHQQINNLFANLFNPNAFAMPRPNFPRPIFSRPSFFNPIAEESEEFGDKIDFDKLPANYSNSTSETKIVDGQVVTVNKTVQKISGNNSNGFFHFSVIKVGPKPTEVNPDVEVEAPNNVVKESNNPEVSETKPTISETDPKMNEVDRPDEIDQEKLSEVEMKNLYEVNNGDTPTNVEHIKPEEEVKIIPIKPAKLIRVPLGAKGFSDLSSDIRVNNLMENSKNEKLRALFDPEDVEIFDV